MGIPLINNRAFGYVGLFGPQIQAQKRVELGNPVGPTISDTELEYKQANAFYNGIKNRYNDLVSLIGEAAAQAAIEQAQAFYEEALKAWKNSRPRIV